MNDILRLLIFPAMFLPLLLVDLLVVYIHYRLFRRRCSKKQAWISLLLLLTGQGLLVFWVGTLIPSAAWPLGYGLFIPILGIPLVVGLYLYFAWPLYLLRKTHPRLTPVLGLTWSVGVVFLFITLVLVPNSLPAGHFSLLLRDQLQQPVVGASVKVNGLRSGKYFGQDFIRTFTSDENGLIEISGFGRAARIEQIDREGYEIRLQVKRGQGYVEQDYLYFSIDPERVTMTWTRPDHSSAYLAIEPQEPVLIEAWKILPPELTDAEQQLINSQHYRYFGMPRLYRERARFRPEPGGDPVAVRGLVSRCELLPDEAVDRNGETVHGWRLTFSAAEGGVQRSAGFYLHEAPVDGYQDEVSFEVSAKEVNNNQLTGQGVRLERLFYRGIESYGHDQVYGAALVEIVPRTVCKVGVSLKYRAGFRSLFEPALKP